MNCCGPEKTGLVDPAPLQKICLDFICFNLDLVCSKTPGSDPEDPDDIIDIELEQALSQINPEPPRTRERLKFLPDDNSLFLHAKLSEELLTRLSDLGKVDDLTLTLFDGSRTCLKKVRIDNASKLTHYGLQNFQNHNITDLEVSNLVQATINDLIGGLNPWTLENLKTLNVFNSTFVDGQKHTIVVALTQLRNLASLNVSGTEFNKSSLEMIMEVRRSNVIGE